jgi:DNA processing protein
VEIKRGEANFPEELRVITESPRSIYCLGNTELLQHNKKIAIVGSRMMSRYGQEAIKILVPELVKNDFCVVSGMAFGIDAEVHKVCLDYGGKTIAVLASGVNVVSPKGNEKIYKEILYKDGLIISEYPDSTNPQKMNFVKRNRIISGLAFGVLIIEGNNKSGTLTTGKMAVEQGKEVMAIPGRINEPNSFAPNYFIKNGAYIITEPKDILQIFDGV